MLRLKHKKYAFAALFNIQNIMQLLKVKVIRNSMVAYSCNTTHTYCATNCTNPSNVNLNDPVKYS